MWYDESFTAYQSQGSLSEIVDVARWDSNPPLYLIIMHYWLKLAGLSEFTLRFPSLIFNSLACSILFLFAYRSFNIKVALLATLFFLSSDSMFYYAQEARAYSFLFLLTILSGFLFFELIRKPGWLISSALAITNAALFYTHYIETVIVVFQFVLIIYIGRKTIVKYYALSFGLFIAMMIPWISRAGELFGQGGNHILKIPVISDVYWAFIQLNGDSRLVSACYFVLIVWSIIAFIYHLPEQVKEEKAIIIYLLLWVIGSFAVIYLLSFKAPMFAKRYLLFSLPGIYLLCAYGITLLKKPAYIFITTSLVFILSLTTLNYQVKRDTDYKSAIPAVQSTLTDQSLVVLQSIDMSMLFAFYFDKTLFSYRDLIEELAYKGVVTVNDSTWLTNYDFSFYKKVIVVQTYENFCDPDGTLLKLMNQKFNLRNQNKDFAGVTISYYDNLHASNVIADFNTVEKQRQLLKLNSVKEKIYRDGAWLSKITMKAEANNTPVDSMVTMDAKWVLEN
ncbi:MAG: glycosyltransferase family 39 protein [Bacteroidota bacterium]